ncbi:hypothetical protein E2C01_035103 [Portunus trituberculatus]|uniref:Uncharacterized protein n=1 Tax=Portunus trituberculatus TaxID=210409 RepID=A0A5B7F8U1_PORTR|nr:hypothetical protein [Portunus trituberculatus]
MSSSRVVLGGWVAVTLAVAGVVVVVVVVVVMVVAVRVVHGVVVVGVRRHGWGGVVVVAMVVVVGLWRGTLGIVAWIVLWGDRGTRQGWGEGTVVVLRLCRRGLARIARGCGIGSTLVTVLVLGGTQVQANCGRCISGGDGCVKVGKRELEERGSEAIRTGATPSLLTDFSGQEEANPLCSVFLSLSHEHVNCDVVIRCDMFRFRCDPLPLVATSSSPNLAVTPNHPMISF